MNRCSVSRGGVLTLLLLAALCAGLARTPGYASSQQTYLDCLVDFERYAETNWHTATHPNAPPDSGYFGDGGGEGDGGIRASCGTALAYAVLAQAFPTATNRTARLAKVRQALDYAANTHVSGTNFCANGTKWGHGHQSAFLSGHMGVACLVVQAELPFTTVQAVQRAVADEATYRAAIPPASGYVNDTKAEENAWNSHVVALAAAWLSTNANAGLWLTSAKRYLVNIHTVANTSGDPLASWVTTITHYPDYALENHAFYHPGYKAASGELAGDSWLMARLADPAVATQLQPFAEHNVLAAWTNYSYALLDSGEVAYAAGEDWDLNDYEQNAYLAWMAAHFDQPTARWAETQVAQMQRYRQLINGNGQFVGPATSLGFTREAIQAYRSAIAWLHWANASYPTGPSAAPGPALLHMPDVGVIEQRGANGFFSICYGPQTNGAAARINAIIEAPTSSFPNDVYTVTPRVPGVLGLGAMGNPTKARLVSLVTNGNTFTAELQLTNGANGTTEVYVNCTGETVAIVEVPQPADGVVNNAAGSFTLGIENAPLNGGSRLLEWNNDSTVVISRSGATRNLSNNWVCVAGHYGVVCGPGGYFKYQAATAYAHGTAEDTLQFMPTNSLTPRYGVWLPGRNAAQTSSNASRVSWIVSATNWVLSFPGPAGTTHQIVVPHSPLAITTQPHALAVTNGEPATFAVVAAALGGDTISYQWQKNGVPIGGATNSSLTIPAAGPADVGNYRCLVTIPGTSVTTDSAPLRLIPVSLPPAVASGTLQLCLRADAGVVTNSSGVTNWCDQSANALRFDAKADFSSTFLPRAGVGITGNRVIRFAGNNRLLCSVPVRLFTQSNSPLTLFTAFSIEDNATQRYLLNLTVPRTNRAFLELSLGVDAGNDGVGNYGIHRAASGATYAPAGTINNNQFYLMSLVVKSAGVAPANIAIYRNGESLPVGGTPPNNPTAPYTEPGWLSAGHYPAGSYPLNIGAVQDSGNTNSLFGFWRGDIGEILIYQGQLSDSDRAAVQTYLGRKYGLFEPQLQIAGSGANVIISYPVLAGAYVLESSPILGPPATWTALAPPPVPSGSQFCLTNPAAGQKYYRLRLP